MITGLPFKPSATVDVYKRQAASLLRRFCGVVHIQPPDSPGTGSSDLDCNRSFSENLQTAGF